MRKKQESDEISCFFCVSVGIMGFLDKAYRRWYNEVIKLKRISDESERMLQMSLLDRILPCDMNKPYIFISYSSLDCERVWEDVLEFQRRGYNVWLDDRNLDKKNPSWKTDALKAIENYYCRLMVFYMSRWSLTSQPCYEELCHTLHEDTVAYHNDEVKYIAVELESISNIKTYKDGIFDNLMGNEEVPIEERQMRAKILARFIRDFFTTNNEKVRVHPRDEADRKMDYYTDVTASFPDSTRIRGVVTDEPCVSAPGEETDKREMPEETPEDRNTPEEIPENPNTAEETPEIRDTPDEIPETDARELLEKADDCFGRKAYEEAVMWYRKAAEMGLDEAQNRLGYCYDCGEGVPADHEEAVKWYRMAADQGLAKAQYNLGNAYYSGRGVPADPEEAVKWYRMAADRGYAKAQHCLGMVYHLGLGGVVRNFEEAVKWYRKAADQGFAEAQYSLGMFYRYGLGTARNVEEAVSLYKAAAAQGHKAAAEALVKMGRG